MSFGFGVGDFLAVIGLATKVVEGFRGAPTDYRAISEEVENVLTVLKIIKDCHTTTTHAAAVNNAVKQLEAVLQEIYGSLVKYTNLLGENSIKRAWERLRWNKEKIDSYRKRLSSCLLTLNTLLSGLVQSDTAKIVKYKEDEDILEWLGPADHLAQHADHCRHRISGTGGWLFEDEEFKNWKGMLLLHGIPGTGKTILASIVIDKVKPTAYYYCDYTRQEQQTSKTILSCLLRQVVTKDPARAGKLYEERTADIAAIKTALLESSPVCIVIDALDECQVGTRRELMIVLQDIAKLGSNVICTSRDTHNAFEHKIEIKASEADVSRFIDGNVSRLPRCASRMIAEIKKAIIDAAGGIFLLVGLHFNALEGKTSQKAIRDQLDTLASNYGPAYDRTMRRINDQNADWAKLAIDALTWVVYAERPLSRLELLHALATDGPVFCEDALPDIEDVLEVCCGLLGLEGSGVIRLVHKTTEEFFQSHPEWLPTPHTKISDVCNNYLAYGELKEYTDELLVKFPLYRYASLYWKIHVNKREQSLAAVDLVKTLDRIELSSQTLIKTMSNDYLELSRKHPDIRGLHLAALGGYCDVISTLLNDQDVNAVDGSGRTPIWFAVKGGHVSATKLLVKNGAEVRIKGKEEQSLLEYAFDHRYYEIAEVLINNRSDLTREEYGYALQAASRGGCYSIVKLLIDNGSDLTCGDYGNALQAACYEGRELIVKMLLEAGADVNAQGGKYGSALQAAAARGEYDSIVKMLLEAGADVNAQGGEYGNALQAAAAASYREHNSTVEMLLEAGADVNAQGGFYGSALQAASRGGCDSIVKLLIEAGADVNAQCGDNGNALQAASEGGHDSILKMLLQAGANVNAQSKLYGNALQAAAASWEGYDSTVKLLIEAGADVNAQGGKYGSALQGAAYRGHDSIVKMLLEAGADVNAQGGKYGSALQAAAASMEGHDSTVKMLLEAGANINAQGGLYGNALQAACYGRCESIVKMLLEAGADVNAQGGKYGSALQAAAASMEGHDSTVKMLLEAGADVNAQGGKYGSALQAAAARGEYDSIVKMLLEAGANVNAQGGEYGSALQAAAASWEGYDSTVKLLLEAGANVNAQGGECGSALQAASRRGHDSIVKMLLEAGAVWNSIPISYSGASAKGS